MQLGFEQTLTASDSKKNIPFPFEVPEDSRYAVRLGLTRSWDYGIWEIFA